MKREIKVQIGEKEYTLRKTGAAKYRLSLIINELNDAGDLAQCLLMASALIQEKNRPTPEQIADAIEDNQEQLEKLAEALSVLLKEPESEVAEADPLS